MQPEPEPPLTAADVTFLIPLQSVADFTASTQGGQGLLLPRKDFDALGRLTVVDEADSLYAKLDVVAVRLDPCFFEGSGTPSCTSQIRLVLQPVFSLEGKTASRDATVHLFYGVPEAEVRTLAAELQKLRLAASGKETIGLHPDPASAAAAVLPYIGKNRLTRITFVSVHASEQAWTFGGFDVAADTLKAIELPGDGHHEQHLTSTGGLMTLDATILPPPTIEPDIIAYLAETERGTSTATQTAAAKAAFERLLDPAEHNPGTVDCASCHMATTAQRFLLPDAQRAMFSPAYENSQNQRMLGFFGAEPSISPRVEAETRAVLKALADQ